MFFNSFVFLFQIFYYLYHQGSIYNLVFSLIVNTILKIIFNIKRTLPKHSIETQYLLHPISQYLGFHLRFPSGHAQLSTTMLLNKPSFIMLLFTFYVYIQRYKEQFHTIIEIGAGICIAIIIKLNSILFKYYYNKYIHGCQYKTSSI